MTDQQGQQIENNPEKKSVSAKTVAAVMVSHSGFQATSTGISNPFSAGFSYHTHAVNALMFSPTENRLAFSCAENNLYICDIAEQGQLYSYQHPGDISALAWSPDGLYLASISNDRKTTRLHIWEVASGKQLHVYEQQGRAGIIQWSPDGTHIAAGSSTGEVKIWRTE